MFNKTTSLRMLGSMIIIIRSISVRKLCVCVCVYILLEVWWKIVGISGRERWPTCLPYPLDMNGLSESTKEITGVWAAVMELNNPHKVWVVCDKKILTLRNAIS